MTTHWIAESIQDQIDFLHALGVEPFRIVFGVDAWKIIQQWGRQELPQVSYFCGDWLYNNLLCERRYKADRWLVKVETYEDAPPPPPTRSTPGFGFAEPRYSPEAWQKITASAAVGEKAKRPLSLADLDALIEAADAADGPALTENQVRRLEAIAEAVHPNADHDPES